MREATDLEKAYYNYCKDNPTEKVIVRHFEAGFQSRSKYGRFECHITMEKPKSTDDARPLFNIAEKHGMKTSWITGDPVLGVGKWFYISGYSPSYHDLLARMQSTAAAIRAAGHEVVWEKIEQILHDTKTGYFTCGVDCTACLE